MENLDLSALGQKIDDLSQALTLADTDVAPEVIESVRDRLERANDRRILDPTTVLVAFVGATGSGKSSLFNALLGADLARTDVVRPTTRLALAAVRSDHDADELLDWVGVKERVAISSPDTLPEGMCIIDAPDIDSIDTKNHDLARRLHDRVDLVVWVVDPQKYADNVIHADWIAPMADRADATIVVLNQVDLLSEKERADITRDLTQLLNKDGIEEPCLFLASALTGEGIPELRTAVSEVGESIRSRALRLVGEVEHARMDLVEALDMSQWQQSRETLVVDDKMLPAFAHAAGVDDLTDAVKAAYRHRRVKACGWLPTRWLRNFRSDPLRRRHLSGGGQESVSISASSSSAGVSLSVRDMSEYVSGDRPPVWQQRIRRLGAATADSVHDGMNREFERTDMGMGTDPTWWRWSNALQWVAWVVAAAGGIWLLALHLIRSFLLMTFDVPMWKNIPIPTLLIAGGIAASLVCVLISWLFGHVGARRRASRARKRLYAAVRTVVDELLLAPLQEEHHRQWQIVELLKSAEKRR